MLIRFGGLILCVLFALYNDCVLAMISELSKYVRPLRAQGEELCVYVDLGAHNGDSFDNFRRDYYQPKRNPNKKTCIRHKYCADQSMRFNFPMLGCPTVSNRSNIDFYGVEANPTHSSALIKRFQENKNILGMYVETGIWNRTLLLVTYSGA